MRLQDENHESFDETLAKVNEAERKKKSASVNGTCPHCHRREATADEVARLDGMTRGELLTLVRRLACQFGLVAVMTKDETAQAMRDVLADTALRPIVAGLSMKADIQARLAAIDKWLDRSEGKARERVEITGNMAVTPDAALSALIMEGIREKLDKKRKQQLIDVTPLVDSQSITNGKE